MLILKVKDPKLIIELRPKRFCNVLYKIIAKTLANGVKSNNFRCYAIRTKRYCTKASHYIATMHFLQSTKRGRSDHIMALKHDMNKVYDRVELGFPKKMMEQINGF